MSKTVITIEEIVDVKNHPNADKLDIVQVLGYQVVTGRDNFKVNDLCVYFPPDILLPQKVADKFNVTKFLKHAVFPGGTEKTQCRVGAARLRGCPSHGFVVPIEKAIPSTAGFAMPGTDVTDMFEAKKYVPPIRIGCGDIAPPLDLFHKYTDIENIQRYPNAFKDGDNVVITEKIHGTNCRLGLVRNNYAEFEFVAGSHDCRRKEPTGAVPTLYWEPMDQDMMALLSYLCDDPVTGQHDVIVFGEIFGKGIQDMQYGQSGHSFRVFDISIDGNYMNYWDMVSVCDQFNKLVVPQLYAGPFSQAVVEEHTYGPSTFSDIMKTDFKGREGIVIRPALETYSDILFGRKIVKSISADYLDRKGAQDNA